jgi:hypothetical protein
VKSCKSTKETSIQAEENKQEKEKSKIEEDQYPKNKRSEHNQDMGNWIFSQFCCCTWSLSRN